jgi:AcrR family transcriptional regulator
MDCGFARMSIEAVAEAAGVGKPAIYRRFANKAELVAHVISRQLPVLESPDLGDSRAELWRAVEQGLPHDGPAYVRLIGGLIAEQTATPS